MTDYAPFPLIDLSGDARERGRTHGKVAADRLRCGIKMYAESLLNSGVDWPELERRAQMLVPMIERFDPSYIEEMRGIAEGANEPFAGVVLMNARTEMVAAARHQQAAKHFPDGCTAALALPEASADGTLLHGQNWDWRAECAETGVVLRIRRDDGPDILTFTEAGGLARSGLNSAGIDAGRANETRSVLETASVRAVAGAGCEEFVQQVSVTLLHIHEVETSVGGKAPTVNQSPQGLGASPTGSISSIIGRVPWTNACFSATSIGLPW